MARGIKGTGKYSKFKNKDVKDVKDVEQKPVEQEQPQEQVQDTQPNPSPDRHTEISKNNKITSAFLKDFITDEHHTFQNNRLFTCYLTVKNGYVFKATYDAGYYVVSREDYDRIRLHTFNMALQDVIKCVEYNNYVESHKG